MNVHNELLEARHHILLAMQHLENLGIAVIHKPNYPSPEYHNNKAHEYLTTALNHTGQLILTNIDESILS